jgi:hypothetical protein
MHGAERVTRRAAGADWAFVSDSSALVIVEEVEAASGEVVLPLLRVVHVREVRNTGQAPRDPADVARLFAADCCQHGVERIMSDAHYRASWEPVLASSDVAWLAAPVRQEEHARAWLALRSVIHARRIILPASPRLKMQLIDVQARTTATGIHVEGRRRREREGGTSHGDLVSALVLAVWQLTRGGTEYEHRGAPSRWAGLDPRFSGSTLDPCFAGIPRGQFHDEPPDLD